MADFHSWSHHNLADLAVELQAENEMLQAANEQLRKDLREAMAVIRDLNRNAAKNSGALLRDEIDRAHAAEVRAGL